MTVNKSDFNLVLLAKTIYVFLFLGPILVPILWLSGVPVFQDIAQVGWRFGSLLDPTTEKSLFIGGYPMMICARCFGVATGILLFGMLFLYVPTLRSFLPRRLYLSSSIALLFVPWLIDNGLDRLGWQETNYWIMVPTGVLGGAALTLLPFLFLKVKYVKPANKEAAASLSRVKTPA